MGMDDLVSGMVRSRVNLVALALTVIDDSLSSKCALRVFVTSHVWWIIHALLNIVF